MVMQEPADRQWRLNAWRAARHVFVLMMVSVHTGETFMFAFDTTNGVTELAPELRVSELPNYYACGYESLPPILRSLLRAYVSGALSDRIEIESRWRQPAFLQECRRWFDTTRKCTVATCNQRLHAGERHVNHVPTARLIHQTAMQD